MLVIDSSVAIKWFSSEPGSAKASRILSSSNRLVAPDLALAEVANALRRKERRSDLPSAAVRRAIEELQRVFHTLVPSGSLIAQAVRLSQDLDHSVYDCMYMVTARIFLAPLVTADGKFLSKLAGTALAKDVVALADWKG